MNNWAISLMSSGLNCFLSLKKGYPRARNPDSGGTKISFELFNSVDRRVVPARPELTMNKGALFGLLVAMSDYRVLFMVEKWGV